jgi:uncharacterized protein (DUF934 family)
MSERPHLIRIVDGAPRIVADAWRVVDSASDWDQCAGASEAADAARGGAGLLLPLALAEAQTARVCAAPGPALGLSLGPDDDPARAVAFFPHITLIGVKFPKFTDGRGYSTAVLLRTRHGWRGELRALGDVLQDQLFALRRVGFDSFALGADRDPQAALGAFAPFSDTYQGSVDQPLPVYARGVAP